VSNDSSNIIYIIIYICLSSLKFGYVKISLHLNLIQKFLYVWMVKKNITLFLLINIVEFNVEEINSKD